jgi:hypothetical protein
MVLGWCLEWISMKVPFTTRSRRGHTWFSSLILLFLVPVLMGGCPAEIQNAIVDAFETGVRGIVDATLDAAFNQIRPSGVR